jgi:GNAT superfamily N-acetyltransferase
MQMGDFIEVSAVITHPDYLGKGYAKQLVAHTEILLSIKIKPLSYMYMKTLLLLHYKINVRDETENKLLEY